MGDKRVTYRRRHSYRTKGNKIKLKKTPGGQNAVHYLKKKASSPICGDCKGGLIGLPQLRPLQLCNISKRQKSVSRAYGGSRCMQCTRSRIVRAFLIEEQKIVKKVMKKKAGK